MPLLDLATPSIQRVDKAWLEKAGYIAKLNALPKDDPLGEMIGDKLLEELGDDWYDVATEISGFERDTIGNSQNYNFQIPTSAIRKAASGQDAAEFMEVGGEQLAPGVQIKLDFLKLYLRAWSHYAGKPKVDDLKRIPRFTFRVLLMVITDIHKGQAVPSDSPLPSK